MGKMKIRLYPDGTIQMETDGIKGKRCTDYAKVLAKLADAKITSMEKTEEYYQEEVLQLDETQHLQDNILLFLDRKSTRLNSSHQMISYAVFGLKKKITVKTSTHRIMSYASSKGTGRENF